MPLAPMRKYNHNCPLCKKAFISTRWKAKYCSTTCAGEAKRVTTPTAQLNAQGAEKLRLLKKGNETISHNEHYVKSGADSIQPKSLKPLKKVGGEKISDFEGTAVSARGGSTSSTPQSENSNKLYTKATPKAHNSQTWLNYFLEFISELKIDSKEKGIIPLRDSLYRGQWMFLEQVCSGLDQGCREFVVLKARQLGITTISLALDLFWMFVHDGLQTGFVAHEEASKEKTREIIERYIKSLPADLKVDIVKHNKYNLVLSNGSIMDYLVAGTTKRTKGLGRGRAYTHIHSTELAFYGSQEAVDSFVAGIAKNHVDRLRIWESTANGFDSPLWEKWSSAKDDTITQKCIFIGWWGNDTYDLADNPQLLEKYSEEPNPDEEAQLIEVEKLYGVKVSLTQLAWYRWYSATQSKTPHMMMQEFPWTEDEAFISTGSKFFDQKRVAADIQALTANFSPFKGYAFEFSDKFVDTRIVATEAVADTTLRVWTKPVDGAHYIISADPSYGSGDDKDYAAIEVSRCYADCMEQVAEYRDVDTKTYQFAWVLAWLAGKYKNCMINLEVSGPGGEVMMEMKHLRELAMAGALTLPAPAPDTEEGRERQRNHDSFIDNMQAARWYIWNRPDSMGAGFAYGWKTTSENKVAALNAMRDTHVMGNYHVRSLPLLDEMTTIVQDGWDIRASGKNHDDLTMASALGVWGWQQWIRPALIADNMTRAYSDQLELAQVDPRRSFMQQLVSGHMKSMEMAKTTRGVAAAWDEW